MKKIKKLFTGLSVGLLLISLSNCGDDDDDLAPPAMENPEEVITDVTLTFIPEAGGDEVVAAAKDPDGDGPMNLEVTQDIQLMANTTYTLNIELLNSEDIDNPEDITEEVMEEDDEHMFFFSWTGNVFTIPEGDGNVDGRDDPVIYNDQDDNGLPLGLSTEWITGEGTSGNNTFRVVLKHQPPVGDDPVKTANSTVEDGDTDVDVTWNISVQ